MNYFDKVGGGGKDGMAHDRGGEATARIWWGMWGREECVIGQFGTVSEIHKTQSRRGHLNLHQCQTLYPPA